MNIFSKMKKTMFRVRILLLSIPALSNASISCKSLLEAPQEVLVDLARELEGGIDYNYEQILRPPQLITLKKQIESILKNYENKVRLLPQGLQPHSRAQCLGTCYLYSGLLLLENNLKRGGKIPANGLLLTGPLLGYLGVERLTENDGVPSVKSLLDDGLDEAFHVVRNRRLFYLSERQVGEMGGAKKVLDLDRFFKCLYKQ